MVPKNIKLALTKCMLAVLGIVSIFSLIRPAIAAPAPTVITGSATNVTFNSATLNSNIPNAGTGPVSSRGFNYGLTSSYGDSVNENLSGGYSYVSQFGETPYTNGGLNSPYGVAIDSSDNVYVVDSTNYKVLKYDNNGTYLSEFGVTGTGNGEFLYPIGIAIDAADNIYIVEYYNNRVQKFDSSGVYQSQFGSTGTGNGQFTNPQAIALDSANNIYVADTGNNRIQKFNSSGVYQSQFGSQGGGNGQFTNPSDVATDSNNNIYVADAVNNRIQKFNSSGVYQSQFGGQGAGNGKFIGLRGITIDSADNIYTTEIYNPRVQKFNSSGVYQSQFGSQGGGNGQFAVPRGLAVDSSGNIFVADATDHRVQKFNNSGTYQSQFGGHQAGELYSPRYVAIDSAGSFYIADTDYNRIQKFNSSGVYQSQFGSYGTGNGQLSSPKGIVVDSADNIYVADTGNHRIQKFNSSGVYQSQFGSYGTGNGQLAAPESLTIDAQGNFYVVDTNNHRIQKFNSSGVYQSQFASQGHGDGELFYPSNITIDAAGDFYVADSLNYRIQKFNSNGTYQSQFEAYGNDQFSIPRGIIIDNTGNIYVADSESGRIQKFNSSGVYQASIGSVGTGNGQLAHPTGIAFDSSGNLYVADLDNYRIQKFSQDMHEGNFNLDLSDLSCSTTYHYQAYATNDAGTAYGSDATFTTASCPEPGPVTNFSASINSVTSIGLSWDAPAQTGDSAIKEYQISYKKVGDTNWQNDVFVNHPDTDATLNGLESGTEYDIYIVVRNENLYESTPEHITATTGTSGFHLINTCQQLQDVQYDTLGSYELAQNINCSDTVNWNNGAGFTPVGTQQTPFSGIFVGNNYSVSDLYINQVGTDIATAALFGYASGALFQDIRIVRPVAFAEAPVGGLAAGLAAYISDQGSLSTSINNVHISDAQLEVRGGQFSFAGGLAGIAFSGSGEVPSDNQNEFKGSIESHGETGGFISIGGLYGGTEGSRQVNNSYANANITTQNLKVGGAQGTFGGGLIGNSGLFENRPGSITFNHSYAAGTIAFNNLDSGGGSVHGGIGGLLASQLTVNNSFAHTSFTNSNPGGMEGKGGIMGIVISSDVPVANNSYFDADLAGTTDCISPFLGSSLNCTPISSDSSYFYNNSNNAPLDTWDFTNIWQTTNTLPVFGTKALSTITEIPASRLNKTPTTAAPSAQTPIPNLASVIAPSTSASVQQRPTNSSIAQEETGLIGAIKRFFKNVPAAVLVSFPYVFFGLLLLGALAMMIEVGLQYRRLRATSLLIARQNAVAEERDTFWHLAANYLRAPITLMVGGVEMLSTDKDVRLPAVAQLETAAKNLQKRVAGIMAQIEQSTTLQDIEWPKLQSANRVLGQIRFWLPVSIVAIFALLINYIAKDYRQLSLSAVNLGAQILIFILVSILFYWVLSAFGLVSRKRDQAKALLDRQTANLDSARVAFIEQAASTLDSDLTALETQLDNLPKQSVSETSAKIVHEGVQRLRALINSFGLLVAAQNHKLSDLSPQNAHSQLNVIFDEVISSLDPLIAQKNIKLVKPDFSNISLPGNTLLLNQVIGSVLSNAVAFSPTDSTIRLDVKKQNDKLRLSVTNQGQTISKDQLSHVFSPFIKADGYDALRLDHGGLGVNLYIDKLIMQYLGGSMNIASEAGRGTTMAMQWPIN